MAAAGNAGTDNDALALYPASYQPDPVDGVVAVAAMDVSKPTLAYFSQYGLTSVDLAAPGRLIYSTMPGGRFGSKSGTSMATPHVAAGAALLLSVEPGLSGLQLKAALMDTAAKVNALDGKVVTGGKLDVAAALCALGHRNPACPSPPSGCCQDLLPLGFQPGATNSTLCAGAAWVSSAAAGVAANQCKRPAGWDKARKGCATVGARLCTLDELKARVAGGLGCKLKKKRAWTADECTDAKGRRGRWAAVGHSGKAAKCANTRKYRARRLCCADACPAEGEADPPPPVMVQVLGTLVRD